MDRTLASVKAGMSTEVRAKVDARVAELMATLAAPARDAAGASWAGGLLLPHPEA